jgi:myosin-15
MKCLIQGEMKRRMEVERAAAEKAKARTAKSAQEEAERSARAVAGVNHLDIPAELAFIFSKLDGNKSINSIFL